MRSREWNKKHPEKLREYGRKWSESTRGREFWSNYWNEHKAEHRKAQREWRERNPNYRRVERNTRKARERSASGSFTTDELNLLFEQQEGFCYYCGELLYASFDRAIHVDHMVPLSRGGTNDISNIVLACANCNLKKHTKTHAEFIKILGGG